MTNTVAPIGVPKHAVCVRNGSWDIGKWVGGHEIGHALAMIIGGPVSTNYDADDYGEFADSLSEYCTCNHIGGSSHCFQSREYIGAAQGEGFAHMVSTSLFNARENGGHFGYYKNIKRTSWWTETVPVWKNLGDQQLWMKGKCEPTASEYGGLGTEWDWSQFFWQLWAHTSTGKFEMSDIATVWSGTGHTALCCSSASNCYSTTKLSCWLQGKTWAPFGRLWDYRSAHISGLDYLVDTVRDEFGSSSPKLDRFVDLGSSTGVDY